MTMKFKNLDFSTGTNEIFQHPDHSVAYAQMLPQNSSLATTVGTRKIVKAGTIFPSNDANAVGIILNDYDVTDGDANTALLVHGFVNIAKLPIAPTLAAKLALRLICFYPVAALPTIDGVQSVVAGTGISVDNTDPANPVLAATGLQSIEAGDGINIDVTDPVNPVIEATGVQSVVAGDNVTIDNTDEQNPIVSANGIVEEVIAGTGIAVDATDPAKPIISTSGV